MANPIIIIPARMASTRLPGKPMADIHGQPMIVHVWRRAVAADIGPVLVAADQPAIDREQAGVTQHDERAGPDQGAKRHPVGCFEPVEGRIEIGATEMGVLAHATEAGKMLQRAADAGAPQRRAIFAGDRGHEIDP